VAGGDRRVDGILIEAGPGAGARRADYLPAGLAAGAPAASARGRAALLLPLAGFVVFAAEALFERPNPIWVAAVFVWALLSTAVAWGLTRPATEAILDVLDRLSGRIGAAIIVGTALGFIVINFVQQRHFAHGAYPEDLAYYGQILWNTFHGQFLSGNIQQDRLYHPPVSSELALHLSPAMLVTLLPLYGLLPAPLTLLVVRDLALAAAAWPLFLLARDRLGGVGGIVVLGLYVVNAAVLAQGFGSFTLLHLAPLPLLWAFYAFSRERFGAFVAWSLVAMCVREDVAITVAGFGLCALVARQAPRWWLFGLAVPVAWWMTATLVIQPAFGRWGNSALDVALAGGSTPLGAYSLLVSEPAWILQGLRDGGLYYLYRVLRGVVFLPVLGVEGLTALPGLASTLFLGRVYHGGTDPFSRFALLSSCMLMAASVLTVARLTVGARHRRAWVVGLLLLAPSAAVLDGVKDVVQARLLAYFERHDGAALREAVARIPPDAAVAAPSYVVPALAHRPRLLTVQYLHEYSDARVEYFVLDRVIDRVTKNPDLRGRYLALLERLAQPGASDEVWRGGDYVVLRVRDGGPR
jgi:hypothetical protein